MPEATTPPTTTTPDASIIIPPPDIRAIIDKMAQFVARVGPKFEEKVLTQERSNPKFGFIQPTNPYHAYYKKQVAHEKFKKENPDAVQQEVREEKEEPKEQKIEEKPESAEKKSQNERKSFLDMLRSGAGKAPAPESQAPTEPNPFVFISEIPLDQVTSFDVELIKLTAQYIAINGDQFLSGLLKREQTNPQFEFLRSGHPANLYFNSLVQSYSQIVRPPRDLIDQLAGSKQKSVILDSILQRVQWERFQKKNQNNKEDAERQEREARALIDWHSFIIVEKIDFIEGEELVEPKLALSNKPPVKTENQGGIKTENDDDMEVDTDMDIESIEQTNVLKLPVRKDYQSKLQGNKKVLYQKCPVCSQDIPVDEIDEHVRIELLDPRFTQSQSSDNRKKSSGVLASGADVFRQLKRIQPHRSDIFDETDPSTNTNDQMSDVNSDKNKDKIIWDGHSSSARGITGISIQEQIDAIHQSQGITKPRDDLAGPMMNPAGIPMAVNPAASLFPDPRTGFPMAAPGGALLPPPFPMMGVPMGAPVPGMMVPNYIVPGGAPPGIHLEEPPAKKQKVEEWNDRLIPEDQWIRDNPEPIVIRVILPNYPNQNGWQLDGNSLSVTISVAETVLKFKEEIAKLVSIPANKQNLKVEGLPFLKDKDTLALYNLRPYVDVYLSVKERGKRGRK